MNVERYFEFVKSALDTNPKCITGILVTDKVFAREKGKGNKPELLCLIYVNTYACNVWGHVFYDEEFGHYVSCLIEFHYFISGQTIEHLFERFDWYVRQKGNLQPVIIQEEWDAFALTDNFADASFELIRMIEVFDFSNRSPFEDNPALDDPSELTHFKCLPIP